jgi:hypothetical protein
VNADNSGFGPPPLSTNIALGNLNEEGIPFTSRGIPNGALNPQWAVWFNALGEKLRDVSQTVRGTRAERIASAATNYPAGTIWQESDTGLSYVARTTSGFVDTNGVNVTWATPGDQFTTSLVGTTIMINSVLYTVSAFVDATHITLSSTAGVQVGVAYSSSLLQWEYFGGMQRGSFGTIPTGLLANDVGLPWFDETHWRLFVWSAFGGAPSLTSPGWNRGPAEVPTAQISILPLGNGTSPGMATGWSLCNGAVVSLTQDDATTTNFTKPNFAGGSFPKGGTAGTYTGTVVAATPPEFNAGAKTDAASTGITVSGAASATVSTGTALAGATQPVVTALTSGGGGGGAVTDPTHQHNLTKANAPIIQPASTDPVSNLIVPFYVKR